MPIFRASGRSLTITRVPIFTPYTDMTKDWRKQLQLPCTLLDSFLELSVPHSSANLPTNMVARKRALSTALLTSPAA